MEKYRNYASRNFIQNVNKKQKQYLVFQFKNCITSTPSVVKQNSDRMAPCSGRFRSCMNNSNNFFHNNCDFTDKIFQKRVVRGNLARLKTNVSPHWFSNNVPPQSLLVGVQGRIDDGIVLCPPNSVSPAFVAGHP